MSTGIKLFHSGIYYDLLQSANLRVIGLVFLENVTRKYGGSEEVQGVRGYE